MSEQWRGLHNPERHFSAFGTGTPVCDECDDALCVPSNPCYCCLAAEVEALREKVKQHEVVFKVQAEALKSTREQVQRVRAVADAWEYYASENGNVRTAWAASSVREALDGDA